MKLNVKQKNTLETFEGGKAARISVLKELERTVASCFLWESNFYEDGETISERIVNLSRLVTPTELANLAIKTRKVDNIRHAPLLMLAVLCQTGKGSDIVSNTIHEVISRADELAEFVAVYAKFNGVSPSTVKKKLSAQAKKGLAKAFTKFDAYSLAKYNRDGAVKLRDVLFLSHAKPLNTEQESTWKKLINNELESPDTWEVALSSGANKKETFTRLLSEDKLGYLALLRNLRNMVDSGVDTTLIKEKILERKGASKVLPFRYIAAARVAPSLEKELDLALLDSLNDGLHFKGKTVILVDVSGSMDDSLSSKSDLSRIDAAATLASIIKGDDVRVFTFSQDVVEVPHRLGMAGVEKIYYSQEHRGTYLSRALTEINGKLSYDRMIVITDEQTADGILPVVNDTHSYLINVSTNKNGVGYGKWVHIDGFSENVLKFINEYENSK
jgi:hypothetical protein